MLLTWDIFLESLRRRVQKMQQEFINKEIQVLVSSKSASVDIGKPSQQIFTVKPIPIVDQETVIVSFGYFWGDQPQQ